MKTVFLAYSVGQRSSVTLKAKRILFPRRHLQFLQDFCLMRSRSVYQKPWFSSGHIWFVKPGCPWGRSCQDLGSRNGRNNLNILCGMRRWASKVVYVLSHRERSFLGKLIAVDVTFPPRWLLALRRLTFPISFNKHHRDCHPSHPQGGHLFEKRIQAKGKKWHLFCLAQASCKPQWKQVV